MPATFKLSNRRTDPDSAESYCNDVGGHLVQYTSQEEQNDVERFYIYGVGACLLGAGLYVAALAGCWPCKAALKMQSSRCPLLPQGYLIPRYHKNYWMGMTATVVKQFVTTDLTIAPLDASSAYRHWGIYMWAAAPVLHLSTLTCSH